MSGLDRRPHDPSSPQGRDIVHPQSLGPDHELTRASVQCLPWGTDGNGHLIAEEPRNSTAEVGRGGSTSGQR